MMMLSALTMTSRIFAIVSDTSASLFWYSRIRRVVVSNQFFKSVLMVSNNDGESEDNTNSKNNKGARGGQVVAHWPSVRKVAVSVPLVVMRFPRPGAQGAAPARRGKALGVCGECRSPGVGAGHRTVV